VSISPGRIQRDIDPKNRALVENITCARHSGEGSDFFRPRSIAARARHK
jgi:hypothetical protein